MIEDKATERLKKRLKDMGLIVNMGADDKKPAGDEKCATRKKSADSHLSKGLKQGGKKQV